MQVKLESLAAGALLLGLACSLKIALANIVLTIAFLTWVVAVARRSRQIPSRGRRGGVHSVVFDPRVAQAHSKVRRAHRDEKTPLGAVHRRPQQEAGEICGQVRGSARWRHTVLLLPLMAWVAVSVLAALISADPLHSFTELPGLLTLALVPMIVSLLDGRRWERLLLLLAVVATTSAVVGLLQYARGASTLEHRLHGLATHYMTFAGWTLVVTLLLIADIVFGRDRRRLVWTVPAAALCTTVLLLGLTRGAWIGLAAGVGLAAAIARPRTLILLPMLAMTLVLALPQNVVERAASTFDPGQPSVRARIGMLHTGLAMVRDHPVFGLGPGMVQPAYPEYRAGAAPQRIPHLHNNVVQIAAERGLVGLGAYLAILAVFVVYAARALRGPERASRPAVAGCLLAVVGVSVAGLFEYNWGDAEVWILTLMCLASPFALVPAEQKIYD